MATGRRNLIKDKNHSVDVIATLIPDSRCCHVARDGAWVWTTKDRAIEMIKSEGDQLWQMKCLNGVIYIQPAEEFLPPVARMSAPQESQKGKRRLI